MPGAPPGPPPKPTASGGTAAGRGSASSTRSTRSATGTSGTAATRAAGTTLSTWAATEGSRGLGHHRGVGPGHAVATRRRAGRAVVARAGAGTRSGAGRGGGPATHALGRGERVVARAGSTRTGRTRTRLEAGSLARGGCGVGVAAVGVRLGGVPGVRLRRSLHLRLRRQVLGLGRGRLGHGTRPRTWLEAGCRLLGSGLLGRRLLWLWLGSRRLGLDRLGGDCLLGRRLLGCLLGRLGRCLGKQVGAVLVFELLLDGRLHRRAGCLHELTQVVQHLEDVLRRDVVLLGEFMDSDLGHVVPPGPNPCLSQKGSYGPLVDVHAHRAVLIARGLIAGS